MDFNALLVGSPAPSIESHDLSFKKVILTQLSDDVISKEDLKEMTNHYLCSDFDPSHVFFRLTRISNNQAVSFEIWVMLDPRGEFYTQIYDSEFYGYSSREIEDYILDNHRELCECHLGEDDPYFGTDDVEDNAEFYCARPQRARASRYLDFADRLRPMPDFGSIEIGLNFVHGDRRILKVNAFKRKVLVDEVETSIGYRTFANGRLVRVTTTRTFKRYFDTKFIDGQVRYFDRSDGNVKENYEILNIWDYVGVMGA